MALFQLESNRLTPIRQLHSSNGLLERDIEDIAWSNLSDLCGEQLFPVCRQGKADGGKPDIVAIDHNGRVVVIEIKRGIERGQLAQILEYAAWATATSLEEIAGMYHGGAENFWSDWQDFTNTDSPVSINSDPRMFLIAEGFDRRTRNAIDFLSSKKIQLNVISVSIYQDGESRQLIDVQGISEPSFPEIEAGASISGYQKNMAWGISLKELLDAGLLQANELLRWTRPRRGDSFEATLLETGDVQLPGGQIFSSGSAAAASAAGLSAANGWAAWRVPRLGENVTLSEVQQILGKQLFESNK
jgi:hypothetical protein